MDVRCKRCDTNTRSNEHDGLVLEKVLTGTSERSVNHDTGKCAVQRWVDDGSVSAFAFFVLGVKVTADGLGQC